MLTDGDKLWIREELNKLDNEHSKEHGEIKDILKEALNRVWMVAIGVAVAVSVTITFFPVDLVTR